MTAFADRLSANLDSVRSRLAAACGRAHRTVSSVRLVAVSKYAPIDAIAALYALGHRDFGESRPQQLAARAAALPADIRWHLIGHLQRNKASLVLPVANVIHSVDSVKLAQRLEELARESRRSISILLEVNVSGEASKDGFTPETLRAAWPELALYQAVQIRGLMTMAPLADDPRIAASVFQRLGALRDELAACGFRPLPELSMGMSGDMEAAVEAGATMIRIGSALFAGVEQQ